MKHQIMYKTALIFGIISNLFFVSCNQGEVEYITKEVYSYNNSTNTSIIIKEWKQNSLSIFTLGQNETLVNSVILGTGGECSINGNISNNSECLLIYSDSLKVIFNNSKVLEFNRDINSNLNILKQENYNYNKINNKRIYTYNFSELDYESAEDCNGNCE